MEQESEVIEEEIYARFTSRRLETRATVRKSCRMRWDRGDPKQLTVAGISVCCGIKILHEKLLNQTIKKSGKKSCDFFLWVSLFFYVCRANEDHKVYCVVCMRFASKQFPYIYICRHCLCRHICWKIRGHARREKTKQWTLALCWILKSYRRIWWLNLLMCRSQYLANGSLFFFFGHTERPSSQQHQCRIKCHGKKPCAVCCVYTCLSLPFVPFASVCRSFAARVPRFQFPKHN